MKTAWLILFLMVLVTGCAEGDFTAPHYSSCLNKLIKNEDPEEIWRYQMEGKDVYLVIPACCDRFIKLFNPDCQLICSPSGGFSGNGDGLCLDFYKNASAKELVWSSHN